MLTRVSVDFLSLQQPDVIADVKTSIADTKSPRPRTAQSNTTSPR